MIHNDNKKLVLFDIDGTILNSRGLGKRAMLEAISHNVGDGYDDNVLMAGCTDQQIIFEILSKYHSKNFILSKIEAIYKLYSKLLKKYFTIANGVQTTEGVLNLIEYLSQNKQLVLGLLTGNIEAGAKIKLQTFDLNKYFGFGAFGNEGLYRKELPDIAVKKAYEQTGIKFNGKDIVIIGDTVNDILCGKHLDAMSIVIDSGWSKYEDIMNAEPDFYCKDFLKYKQIEDIIINDSTINVNS